MSRLPQSFILTVLLSLGPVLSSMAQDQEPPEIHPVTTSDPEIPLASLRIMVRPLDQQELQVEADAWFSLLKQKAQQIAAARLGVQKTNQVMAAAPPAEAPADDSAADEPAADNLPADEPAEDAAPGDDDAAVDPANVTAAALDEVDQQLEGLAPEAAGDVKDQLLEDVGTLIDERTAISDRLEIVLDSLQRKGGEVETYRQYAIAVAGVDLDASDAQATWATFHNWMVSKEGGQRWAWNLVRFLAILLVAYLLAKILSTVVHWLLEKKVRLTKLAERLIANTIRNVLLAIGFTVALTALEIDITPILAAIGATGLVVGLALQSTLSNFASGLMILINRPFDVDDVVTAGGITGKIHQMNLVSTTFRTFDNQTIHVPNNEIWSNVITNITANQTRRVDLEFGIGYEDDFEQAEQLILETVRAHELVLSDPEPVVITHALADSSVNIVCRPWARTSDWWQVKTELTRAVKKQFDAHGISIPFPQRDVHVHQQTAP
ncbi:mechanosensitive ion channel family protein [Roseimaritima ulvae]|uniref:Small-conductance mechanosensitive channel n=2 Tax=Roseimaritima ulvae TaxID=980254 RepID=A0A5B9R082_9BACT|nr:mechanosensitive ion channel family protein [Roseimaritima ulvae]QEG43630.1 Small-conductance mechanosensitive channel [Roseimaritima ulvae]